MLPRFHLDIGGMVADPKLSGLRMTTTRLECGTPLVGSLG